MKPSTGRAVVFEDHYLLAESLTDLLKGLGFDVFSAAPSVEQAVRLAQTADCDVAIVDLDLRGELAYPALDELERRGVPYILATAAARRDIPARYKGPLLQKPYSARALKEALERA
jgi:DNA-binding response OmpR family regulator